MTKNEVLDLWKKVRELAPAGWFLPSTVRQTRSNMRVLETEGFVESSRFGSRTAHYRLVPHCEIHGEKLPCEECEGLSRVQTGSVKG